MTIGTATITVYRGEDATLTLTMDPNEDITGWALQFNVKDATTQVISKSATVDDGPGGIITVALEDTDTDGLRVGVYLYDVWRTDDGSERPLARGDFIVLDVARDVS